MFTKANWATSIGYCSLLFWAMGAVFTAQLTNIPTFEILSIAFSISFILAAFLLTYTQSWHKIKQPLILWIVGMLGVYGNDALYVLAFKHAPVAQADLINYLWPITVILLATLLPKEKLTLKHLLSGVLGFLGVYWLITKGQGLQNFSSKYYLGYMFAFADALVWSVYTLVARYYCETPAEMIGMYCGFGMIFSLVTHFSLETTVAPSYTQLGIMLLMGLTTQGLAYFFWDFGVKKGDFKLLTILSYGNPILSVFLLVLFGLTTPSWVLFGACFLVGFGGMIAGVDWQQFSLFKVRNLGG